jgi:DNA-binding transcriptional ArsR family regulator
MSATPTGLFGSPIREEILKVIVALDRGAYARQIASLLERDLITVQRNLRRLEEDGILASRFLDRVRLFELNRRYRYVRQLGALLQAMLHDDDRIRSVIETLRQRPRRTGKPL